MSEDSIFLSRRKVHFSIDPPQEIIQLDEKAKAKSPPHKIQRSFSLGSAIGAQQRPSLDLTEL